MFLTRESASFRGALSFSILGLPSSTQAMIKASPLADHALGLLVIGCGFVADPDGKRQPWVAVCASLEDFELYTALISLQIPSSTKTTFQIPAVDGRRKVISGAVSLERRASFGCTYYEVQLKIS
jgi:hypothetical protein